MSPHGIAIVWNWIKNETQLAVSDPMQALSQLWETFGPDGKQHLAYLFDHQYHLIIEGCLLLAIFYLLAQSRAPAKTSREVLSEEVCKQ
jgi:hypothetical protein